MLKLLSENFASRYLKRKLTSVHFCDVYAVKKILSKHFILGTYFSEV